jgi:hypothetical protein
VKRAAPHKWARSSSPAFQQESSQRGAPENRAYLEPACSKPEEKSAVRTRQPYVDDGEQGQERKKNEKPVANAAERQDPSDRDAASDEKQNPEDFPCAGKARPKEEPEPGEPEDGREAQEDDPASAIENRLICKTREHGSPFGQAL